MRGIERRPARLTPSRPRVTVRASHRCGRHGAARSVAFGMYPMKKLILAGAAVLALVSATPATAADIPVPAYQPARAVVLFSWTGFYIGAHGGGGWGRKETTSVPYAFAGALIAPAPAT